MVISEQQRHAVCPTKAQLGVPLISDYVRILQPDLDYCTRRHRAGAVVKVQAREQSTRDDARYTELRDARSEPFVTVSRQCHVQLAARVSFTLKRRYSRERRY